MGLRRKPPPSSPPRKNEKGQHRRRTSSLVGYVMQQVVCAPVCLYDFGLTSAENVDVRDYSASPDACPLRVLL